MEIKDLERALEVSLTQPRDTGYFILRMAVEAFLTSQKKAVPVNTQPSQPNTQKWPEGLSDLVKRMNRPSTSGCPACGCPDGVPHFCTGRRNYPINGTGIEYYLNQPTATGVANGQRNGGQGTTYGAGEGR